MKLTDAVKLYRISYRQALKLANSRQWGARKRRCQVGRGWSWDFTRPPCNEAVVCIDTISDALGVSAQWIERMCKARRLESFKAGNQWRIPMSCASRLMMIQIMGKPATFFQFEKEHSNA